MGLTSKSVGRGALDTPQTFFHTSSNEHVIALAGNPNVGKSTLFNALTGMHQHTGNWPGKTVATATGHCHTKQHDYLLVDIPGTYSLLAHSAEEEVARNFICFGEPDAVVVVCDATCPERNLNLALQILECGMRVIVCFNLMDEAKRKHIHTDLALLTERLGVPVIGVVARKKKSLRTLREALDRQIESPPPISPLRITYPDLIEHAITTLQTTLDGYALGNLDSRWLALRLLEHDDSLLKEITDYLGTGFLSNPTLKQAIADARHLLEENGIDANSGKDLIASAAIHQAEEVCRGAVHFQDSEYNRTDRRIDRLLTGKWTAYPIMLLFLALIFFLTITVSNYPSQWLSSITSRLLAFLSEALIDIGAPLWLRGVLVDGILGVLCWVVSVMLPPMAIFFPLFTLLEDAGYLPRIAYNLDRPFQRCNACGKQALTMCMGFGCNAAGVVGCRIIDSPRERLLAILTNSFIPCNGRFPTLITVISIFFVGVTSGSDFLSTLILCITVLLAILLTFAVTKLLSSTILRGIPSSFTLELPPFRPPQIGRVIFRSIFDRTLFVLGRAVVVAAPAGLLIWIMANVTIGDLTLLSHCAMFLDPFARLLGMDGVILMAFILGFPANEIVIPIIIMAYLSSGRLTEFDSLLEMKALFVANGWTWVTAVSVLIFMLFHWPCSTTLLTVKKETGSLKWTILAALLPTAIGILLCLLFNTAVRLFA